METLECIKTRRSVRSYKPDPIPDNLVKEILEAAIQAPSSGNVEDWEFVVVKSQETKEKLVDAAWGQGFIAQAPLVIVVCSDLERISYAYGMRGKNLYSIQNTAAAIENLLLVAWDKGVASCWVGAFNEQKVKDILVLPTRVRPLAIIPLGYPLKLEEKSERRDLDEVVHKERY